MRRLSQSPTDPAFVQDPYPFYDRARAGGDLFWWEDYGLPCAVSHRAVSALLRDRRLGREAPSGFEPAIPPHLRPFYDIEAHSMLELEPPRHTRLRGLVLRAFTSRRIAALGPEIETLCDDLIDRFPRGPFDLLEAYGRVIPVVVIARLLGVPEERAPDLLRWSNAMVGMYQARRTRAMEDAAVQASIAFRAFVEETIARRRRQPGDDLLSALIAAEEEGHRLTTDEMVTTCILLLNAGHEATVHSLGNGAKALMQHGIREVDETVVEEILRWDPPLHMFTRWVYEDCDLFGFPFRRGDRVALLLGAANRDPEAYADPAGFDPARKGAAHVAFGAGIHFCVGAPLARLELLIGLRRLLARCPGLRLVAPPVYADVYHFHGLERLMVEV
ncbi:Cytochrome P450 [Rubellimicrobium thermophilum DSM 16684]|uniref:Cytochrome P450 n=1 Tax=Rubellimicrobium thermophilum DSM 16684 TaxID=1123069 RepID=S9RZA5_9RHOB|nr:cytochrome P450 [Rubellimicrobium thermophilum]EPX83345.1 Cytochrome P450 [Rubellimicrobium thermophilum DSM 16684]